MEIYLNDNQKIAMRKRYEGLNRKIDHSSGKSSEMTDKAKEKGLDLPEIKVYKGQEGKSMYQTNYLKRKKYMVSPSKNDK